jgi:hypothetical protein
MIIEIWIDGNVTWRMICRHHGEEAAEWQGMIHEDIETFLGVLELILGSHLGMDGQEIGSEIEKGTEAGVQQKRIGCRNLRLLNMVVVSGMWA